MHYHNHESALGGKHGVERTTQAGGAVTSLREIRTPPDPHAAVEFFFSSMSNKANVTHRFVPDEQCAESFLQLSCVGPTVPDVNTFAFLASTRAIVP